MMNRSIGKKANDYFLEIIEWIPRLIHLQLLWFLCVLPVFTLGTASRTVLYMIYHYKKNEEKKLGSLFWKKFRENFSLYGKQDSLASSYFRLLFIDYRIFHYLGGRIGYTLMYTTLFLLLLSAVLFSYKILLQLENQKEVSWIVAFFLCTFLFSRHVDTSDCIMVCRTSLPCFIRFQLLVLFSSPAFYPSYARKGS